MVKVGKVNAVCIIFQHYLHGYVLSVLLPWTRLISLLLAIFPLLKSLGFQLPPICNKNGTDIKYFSSTDNLERKKRKWKGKRKKGNVDHILHLGIHSIFLENTLFTCSWDTTVSDSPSTMVGALLVSLVRALHLSDFWIQCSRVYSLISSTEPSLVPQLPCCSLITPGTLLSVVWPWCSLNLESLR